MAPDSLLTSWKQRSRKKNPAPHQLRNRVRQPRQVDQPRRVRRQHRLLQHHVHPRATHQGLQRRRNTAPSSCCETPPLATNESSATYSTSRSAKTQNSSSSRPLREKKTQTASTS